MITVLAGGGGEGGKITTDMEARYVWEGDVNLQAMLCTDLGVKTHPSADSLLAISLVGGIVPSSGVGLPNPQVQFDPVILPTCHKRALALDGPACLEFELQRGMSLLNLNCRELVCIPT